MKAEREMSTAVRDAQRISTGMTIVALLAAAGVIYSTATNPLPDNTPWLINFAPALVLPTLIGGLLGVWYSRQNQPERATQAIIGGLLLTTLLVPAFAARRAVYLTVLSVAVSISIATMTMSDRRATRTILAVIVAGIFIVFVDLLYPFPRLTGGNLTPIGLVILLGAAVVFAVLAALRFNTFQLRSKLLILFALLPGFIISIIGVYLLTNLNNQTLQQAKSAMLSDVEIKKNNVTALLADAETDARLLSQSTSLTNYLRLQETTADPEALAAARADIITEFRNLAQTKRIYHQVQFFDNQGRPIVDVTAATGSATAVAPQTVQSTSVPDYAADALALTPGEIFISPLTFTAVPAGDPLREAAIHFGAPVLIDGQKAGVIILSLPATQLTTLLANTQYPSWLVDQAGVYLYHPDPAKQAGSSPQTAATLWQDVPALSDYLFNGELQANDAEIEIDYYTFTPVTVAGETAPRWAIINYASADTLWGPINDRLVPMQAVLAIMLLLAPLMAIYISQSIGAPIAQITAAAQQVASENLDVELNIQRRDELGALASAFSLMTQRLRSAVELLESRVAARTRDLVLAAEVSSKIAQVRELNALLAEAVEIIRSRFDLYYAQIYLVEENTLVLYAGTGSVGSDLLNRRFKLPIGRGSINGTAAAEKRAIIVADTAASPIFLPNPLLPDTRSEMSTPLMIGERIVGVLNMQSDQPNALTTENLPAFEALAGQLAIAIENARLFSETQQARAEIEEQARFLTRAGWEHYLDGIHRQEFVGYRYANARTKRLVLDEVNAPTSHDMPISVAGIGVGALRVDAGEQRLSAADREMLKTVAQQIGQRLENLRLLAEAEQYRLEAEQSAQRRIKAEWEAYQQESTLTGFVYDRLQVTAVNTPNDAQTTGQPLLLRGQPIGYLSVDGAPADKATQEIVTAVAGQLSQHVENLRLSNLTAQRAAQLAIINRVAQALSKQVETEEIIDTLYQQLQNVFTTDGFHLGLYDEAGGKMDYPLLYEDGKRTAQKGVPLNPHSNAYHVLNSGEPLLRNLTAEEIEEIRRKQPDVLIGENDGRTTCSLIFVPLRAGQRIFGVLSVQSYRPNAYNQSDLALLNGIASYAAVGLENARLFELRENALAQLQTRSSELALINRVMADVSGTLDLRESMQIITDRLTEAISAEQIGVALLNEDATHLTIVAEKFDPLRSSSAIGIKIPIKGNPSTERVLATRQTVVIKEAQRNPLTAPIHKELQQRGVQTLIIIPMTAGSEIVGTVGIDILDPAIEITPEQIRLAETIVLQAATAAQKARLFEQTQAALSETATLYQASTALNEAANFMDVLQALQRHTVLGAKAQHVAIDYFDHPWTESQQPAYFEVIANISQLDAELRQSRYYLADFPEIAQILTPNAPTFIKDISQTDRLTDATKNLYLHTFGSQATLFVPLTVSGQWLGFINALFAQPTTLTDSQLRRLMAIANQAAIAVQSISLLNSATARAKREEVLRAIAAKVRSSADVDVVMRTAAREIGQALGRQTFIDLGHKGNGQTRRTQEDA